MTVRPLARVGAAAALVAVGITALTGCDPVAWARKTPAERASESRSLSVSSPSVAASAGSRTTCAADAATEQRIATVGATPVTRPTDRSALDAAIGSAGGRAVRLGATTVGLRDFLPDGPEQTYDGALVGAPSGGLIGAGPSATTLQLVPGTSTRADTIPAAFPQTNRLYVLGVSSPASVLHGFGVHGTAQGHLYNGLFVDGVDGLSASNIQVDAIPGDDKQPPGETFAINDFRTVGSQWSHITVDGAGVGGSGFATNGSKDVTICDAVSRDNAAAMGFAFWQTTDLTLVDCSAVDNGFSGFNFERVSGSVTLVRPIATGNEYGMRIASDRGSASYTIVDPTLVDGHWTVTLPKRWYGTANRQRVDDIHLIVDGRSRPDLLRIVRY